MGLKIYSFKTIVTKNDLDSLNHVNNLRYLKWVLEASTRHWDKLSNSVLNDKIVWIVLQHKIDYLKPAFLNDELTIKTWVGDTFGVKSVRFVEILKGEQIIVQAKTTWCLIDKKSMKPIRISNDVLSVLGK